MYVYIESKPGLYTVGFYAPDGRWNPESDHDNREEAAQRVSFLNGNSNVNERKGELNHANTKS